jgi:cyanophycin synthetase
MLLQIKVMRGPNIWGEHHCLYVLKLDNQILKNGNPLQLYEKINKIFQLKCKLGHLNSREYNIALWFAEVCQLLQQMAGSNVQFFSAKQRGNSIFSIFEFQFEEAGKEALRIAESIFLTLINGSEYNYILKEISSLRTIINDLYLGPSTSAIVNEAKQRGIPVRTLAEGRFIFLGYGKLQKRIEGSICETTSSIAVDIAGDKRATKILLAEALVPVPSGIVVYNEKELHTAIEKYGFPLVTKPLDGHQGKNITTNITHSDELVEGYKLAQKYSSGVIVEKYIKGKDYRFLVVNYKLVAVAERSPALVVGNGVNTIRELVEQINTDPKRGVGHENLLTKIAIDDLSKIMLKSQGFDENSIAPSGVTVILKDTANLSTGGTAKDVTDIVHLENVLLAERIAHLIGLDICGIDIMAPDVSTPISKNGGAVLEVNAAPGLRMHIAPSEGKPRAVGKVIVELMFPNNSNGRIPIVSVTGTNGKTTTSRLMAFMAQIQGYNTGFTTTEGVYLNTNRIETGDCTGPKSSAIVLNEPTVEFAVLECARGGILRSGLGYDYCDVGIVTNVAADHLGQDDIYSIEEMAEVKGLVPRSVKPDGYAVLNAENDYTYRMAKDLHCNVAFFAMDASNPRILNHCADGGIACVTDDELNVVIRIGLEEMIIINVKDVPLTLNGKATFMIENVLAVTLAAYLMKFPFETITAALRDFRPDENLAPGRMNITDINSVHVMVDYAHNPHSLKAFSKLMNNIDVPKTGILTGVGDRRDEDIIEIGKLAAEIYDRIIIRMDDDTRGRDPLEIIALLKKGIQSVFSKKPVVVIPRMKDAVKYAIQNSVPDSYVVVNVEKVFEALEVVKELKKEFEHA